MIHGHGNDIHLYDFNIKADFSSNVWYKGISDELIGILTNSVQGLHNYPEADSSGLRTAIATHYKLSRNNVMVTNGSTEAFYLVAQAFSGGKSVIINPCFSEYADACQMHYHKVTHLQNISGWQDVKFNDKLVWLANPNNPDGKTLTLDEIALLLRGNPSSTFVLDEAYNELCYDTETAIPLLYEFSNLIIIRSFTKAFAIPGLRLGFLLASEAITSNIRRYQMPWSVNSLAIAAGMHIMEHYESLLPDKAVMRDESVKLQKELAKNRKLKVFPSSCNFFLVKSLAGPASKLKKFLLEESGILIRDAANFKGLDESYFRVSVQHPQANQLLVKGIKYWTQL
jgi:threonine-phosphate decarboxylase